MARNALIVLVGVLALGAVAARMGCSAEEAGAGAGGVPRSAAVGDSGSDPVASGPFASDSVEPTARADSPAIAPAAEGEHAGRAALLPADPPHAAEPAATHVFRGRVLDATRRPAAGARVELRAEGSAELVGSTEADGTFELAAVLQGDARDVQLTAHDGRGNAARRQHTLQQEHEGAPLSVELEPLVLLPGHTLSVRVLEGGSPVPGARVRLELGHSRTASFEREADADGRLEVDHLPAGAVHLSATSEGLAGRARAFVPEERSKAIELVPLGEAEVHVVDAASGSGIAGAEISVSEWQYVPAALPAEPSRMMSGEYMTQAPVAKTTTDADGRARIVGLHPAMRCRLQVQAEGYAPHPPPRSGGTPIAAGGEPVRIELRPIERRTVRWPVVAGEVPVPPDGAPIELRHAPGMLMRGEEGSALPLARMEGGFVVAEGLSGRPGLTGEAPDGSLARLWAAADAEEGAETSFRRPRRIEVLVRDAAGAPFEGASVIARNQGNNELGPASTTDADGLAVLEGLYGELANVFVARPGGSSYGSNVGSVDLSQGDGRLQVTLQGGWLPARLAVVIEGQRRLPGQYRLRSAGKAVRVTGEDPERGEIALELEGVEPGSTAGVTLDAVGFVPASVELAFPADGSAGLGELRLEPGSRLVAKVHGSTERMEVQPERFDEEQGAWLVDRGAGVFRGLSWPNGPGGSFVFRVDGPGRRRVVERVSGAVSSEAELLPGQREAVVDLELGSAQWVGGRVELEDPAELARVRVIVLGLESEDPGFRWMPAREPPTGVYPHQGVFRVRIPGDRDVRIVPWHPWLVPTGDGTVLLREGRDDVVLRLTEGDELRLAAPQLAESRRISALRIARFAGEPAGEPLEWHHAPFLEGVARCSLPRGRWTLWIDPGADYAPFVLREVEIEGVTALAAPPLSRGSSLRVRILVPEGQSPPRIYVHARALAGLPYYRDLNSRGEAEVRLSGLGPGRFEIGFNPIGEWSRRVDDEIELDGQRDHQLELDLRK